MEHEWNFTLQRYDLIFLIDSAPDYPQRMICQRPLQRLGFIPWRTHPHIAFFIGRQNDGSLAM
jgi:hypothetical protein